MSETHRIRRVCVFCGSSFGTDPVYRAAAENVGRELLHAGYSLVYGGGSVGLMGVVADTMLAGRGEVIGVIPRMLATKELLHPRVSPMHVVPTMHDRKALMAELSDAFLALPGGFGTFEELLEALTWSQLGIHRKPVGILDINGFFAPLIALLDRAISDGFIKQDHRQLMVVDADPATLLSKLSTHSLPVLRKWADSAEI